MMLVLRSYCRRLPHRSFSSAIMQLATKGPFDSMHLDLSAEKELALSDDVAFKQDLTSSLAQWKQDGKNSVWLQIGVDKAHLVTPASECGFVLHHTRQNSIYMNTWLSDRTNMIPSYATHSVGVGGFVYDNATDKILVVKEQGSQHWKLPGGTADPGEDIGTTAMREVYEETGIDTKFSNVLCMRELHGYRYETSDFYFVCGLTPETTDITPQLTEVSDATWMTMPDYLESLQGHENLPPSIFNIAVGKHIQHVLKHMDEAWWNRPFTDTYKSPEHVKPRQTRSYNLYHSSQPPRK